MQLVRMANPHYERIKRSSLRPLLAVLDSATGTAMQVQGALGALPQAKALRYKDALYYLVGTYGGLQANHIPLGAPGKTNAARFTRTQLPNPYRPQLPHLERVVAPSAFLNQTVEQYLLSTNDDVGVLLIHLTNHDPSLDLVFNTWKVVDHINSVLRVARLRGFELCVLHQQNPPVCAALQAEADAFVARTNCHVHPHHMGGHNGHFLAFAQGHDCVVVMGFDACVCVRANMFGSPEQENGAFVTPLIVQTDLVTSRAVLVTAGNITPNSHRGEFGVLYNT
jgi:hypothetical protein